MGTQIRNKRSSLARCAINDRRLNGDPRLQGGLTEDESKALAKFWKKERSKVQ